MKLQKISAILCCFALGLCFALTAIAQETELVFEDHFENYSDAETFTRMYDSYAPVGSEKPELSQGSAANGANALHFYGCNGRSAKVKLGTVVSNKEHLRISLNLRFSKVSDNFLTVSFGNGDMTWAIFNDNIDLFNDAKAGQWRKVVIERMPCDKEGNRKVILTVDGVKTEQVGKCRGEREAKSDVLRLGVAGDGADIEIDDIRIEKVLPKRAKTGKALSMQDVIRLLENKGRKGAEAIEFDYTGDGVPEVLLVNPQYIIGVIASKGATASLFIDRANGNNLAGGDGMFREMFWSEVYDEQHYVQRPYKYEISEVDGGVQATFTVKGSTGIYNYLTIKRTIFVPDNGFVAKINVLYHNDPNSVGVLEIFPWFHNECGTTPDGNTFHVPEAHGITSIHQKKITGDVWWREPTRGWFAISGSEDCICAGFDYANLQLLYTWAGSYPIPTFEWRLFPIRLNQDETFEFQYSFAEHKGLQSPVAVSKQGYAAELELTTAENGTRFACKIYGIPDGLPFKARRLAPESKDVLAEVEGRVAGGVASGTIGAATEELSVIQIDICDENGNVLLQAEQPQAGDGRANAYTMTMPENRIIPEGFEVSKGPDFDYMTKLDTSFVTPHFKWGKPSAKGKIKVLSLIPVSSMRETVEMMQRFDMDCDSVYINQGPPFMNGDFFGRELDPQTVRTIRELVQANTYDLFLLGGLEWSTYIPEDVEALILEQIEKGAGMVYVTPTALSEKMKAILPEGTEAPNELGRVRAVSAHPITDGLDLALLAPMRSNRNRPDALATVTGGGTALSTASYGNGRIAIFQYALFTNYYRVCGGGITPRADTLAYNSPDFDFDYHEYYLALAGRAALWCAKRELSAPAEITLRADGQLNVKGVGTAFDGELCDGNGNILHKFQGRLEEGTGTVELPAKPYCGKMYVRIRLLNDEKQVMGFGAKVLQIASPAIENLSNLGVFGERIRVGFKLQNAARIELRLCDAFERQCDTVTVAAGATMAEFDYSKMLSEWGRVYATAYNEDGSIAMTARTRVKRPELPGRNDWDEFRVLMCGLLQRLACREYLEKYYYEAIADFVPKYMTEDKPFFNAAKHGYYPYKGSIAGMAERWGNMTYWRDGYLKTRDKQYLCRKRDFDNPEFLQSQRELIREWATQTASTDGGSTMIDEDEYSMPELDFDFSPTSLAAFRNVLREKYGSLEALNAEWETAFKKWDEVEPMTHLEIRERGTANFSPWVDHRLFNNFTVAKAWKFYQAELRKYFPGNLMGQSGTRPSKAYGGNDWYLLMHTMDFVLAYSYYCNQYAYQRTLGPAKLAPWLGGYGRRDADKLWFSIAQSGRDGLAIYSLSSIVRPDFSGLYTSGDDLRKAILPFQAGRGEMLQHSETNAEVAIYFSMPSCHTAWITNQEKLYEDEWFEFVRILEDMAVPYKFIASQQVEAGELSVENTKVLLLPATMALSREECKAIIDFVNQGGHVIADAMPGVFDGHGKMRKSSGLSKLFDQQVSGIELALAKEPMKVGRYMWRPMQKAKGKPVLFKQNGRGTATLLNALCGNAYTKASQYLFMQEWRDKAFETQDFFRAMLAQCGVRPVVGFKDEYRGSIKTLSYRNGNDIYIALYSPAQHKSVDLALPPGHVWYDSMSGTAYGATDSINVSLKSPVLLVGLGETVADLSPAFEEKPQLGKTAVVSLAVSPESNAVFYFEVFRPDGKQAFHYNGTARNKGKAEILFEIPFAPNDMPGNWKLAVTDARTGQRKEVAFDL